MDWKEIMKKYENKPSENRLFLGLWEEFLENGCPQVLKGKFQNSILSCLLIALKDAPITTYGRKIANLTLWNT
jgi:hypothetical protein